MGNLQKGGAEHRRRRVQHPACAAGDHTGPAHPLAHKDQITLKDISERGLLLSLRAVSAWRTVELAFRQHDLQFKVPLEAGDWEVIKKHAGLGTDISIVTDVCLTDIDKLAVKSLGKYFPTRSLGLVLHRGNSLSPAAVRYIDVLREYHLDRIRPRRANAPITESMGAAHQDPVGISIDPVTG